MINKWFKILCVSFIGLTFISFKTFADGQLGSWNISAPESKISFGSIKKNKVGEVHHFPGISGSVKQDGNVEVNIQLSSVQTNIDVRNERMLKWVFDKAFPKAMLIAKLDMAELNKIMPGKTGSIDVEGKLSLNGKDIEIETTMFVARISEKKVLVTTDEMIFISTKDLGVDEGITKLMEIAKLPSITRAVPVTIRLVFTRDVRQANVQPAKIASEPKNTKIAGDLKLGKRVFKKCAACHEVKKEKNKVGPHLVGLINRKIGSVENYKYSKAMAALEKTWTIEELKLFLKAPKKYLPKTKMIYKGLKKDTDIDNLLAYIASVKSS